MLHFAFSSEDPLQNAPPSEGGGWLHSLVLVLVPSPQSALQEVQGVQLLHPPSTGGGLVEQDCTLHIAVSLR